MTEAIPIQENGFVVHPHIVLLGAGASVAAAPQGDKNGKKIPILRGLPDALEINELLAENGFSPPILDFEQTFTEICGRPELADLRALIEQRVYSFFSTLEIPTEPNVYDYLVTGLRSKDVIATFNWDPFLIQAMVRNNAFEDGPKLLFLHGNVSVGHCLNDRTIGYPHQPCSKCGEPFTPSNLLYPVGDKDYASDPFIASQWDQLKKHLKFGYGFSIFGYSGPKTDAVAREMMKEQWCSSPIYRQSEVEIIDILEASKLEKNWNDILFSHHYRITSDWKKALFFQHPRRTTEALFDSLLMCVFLSPNSFPEQASFSDISRHIEPLQVEERSGIRQTEW